MLFFYLTGLQLPQAGTPLKLSQLQILFTQIFDQFGKTTKLLIIRYRAVTDLIHGAVYLKALRDPFE